MYPSSNWYLWEEERHRQEQKAKAQREAKANRPLTFHEQAERQIRLDQMQDNLVQLQDQVNAFQVKLLNQEARQKREAWSRKVTAMGYERT